jgi:predicted transcriptional regulator
MRIELELPDELFDELSRVAETMEISDAIEAATIAVADWVSRRKAELDDRDPEQRYFINEALDQLARKKN